MDFVDSWYWINKVIEKGMFSVKSKVFISIGFVYFILRSEPVNVSHKKIGQKIEGHLKCHCWEKLCGNTSHSWESHI